MTNPLLPRLCCHGFLFSLAVLVASSLPLPAAGSRPVVTLAPDKADGGEIVTASDGRAGVSLPARSSPSGGYRWRLPEPLAPGWWEMSVEFARRPKDSPRMKFFFGTPLAPVYDLTDADNPWNLDRFRLRIWCAGPLASLEIRPQRRMPEAIRAIAGVTFTPVDGPVPPAAADAAAPGLLGVLVEATATPGAGGAAVMALSPGLPRGNWQIRPRFREAAAQRTGTMTATGAGGERIVAPVSGLVNVFLDEAPVSLAWEQVAGVTGAVLQSVPAYRPRLPLDRKTAPLPVASADRRARIVLSFSPGVSGNAQRVSLPLLPAGMRMAAVTSWDDGAANDLRCAELLEKYGFHGTFFLMQNQAERADFIAELERRGMEIGSHTVNHPHGWMIAPGQWAAECLQMRLRLEAALGHPVISFAYPYNYVRADDAHGDYVLRGVRAAGYLSGRTTRNGGESITGYAEPLALVTDAHFLASPEQLAKAWERAASQPGGVFYFWGHSYEIATATDWERFDALLARYGRKAGVWYATQGQLFLWRWLRENVREEQPDVRNGKVRVTLSWPRLDRWLARQVPLTLQMPEGVTRVAVEGAGEFPVINGSVTLPAGVL
ncbi:polysaccharide deacetylase [Opitutaceae bacterium TAV5]|nr:polysaccharide deacetylase [Opitutaceae bacterium TAV5]